MEKWISPAPEVLARPSIDIVKLSEFFEGKDRLNPEEVEAVNNLCGLESLGDLAPAFWFAQRPNGVSASFAETWHTEAQVLKEPVEAAIISTLNPSLVVVGELPRVTSITSKWHEDPSATNKAIKDAVMAGTAEVVTLGPNVYYRILYKTLHAKSGIELTGDQLRIVGRKLLYV